jgi:inhibitor of KinA sporulation pathway (predicted exonuclease)
MHYIVLDLEFNNLREITAYFPDFWDKYPQIRNNDCPNEIIEVGAVKLDKFMKVIDSLRIYIRPSIYPLLNPRIKEITGIKESDLDRGLIFSEALNLLADFVGENSIICSWAKDDIAEIIRNSTYHNFSNLEWMREYIDIQEYCTKILAERKSLSLINALDKLKIKVNKEELHDALNDALYTAEVFRRVFNARVIKNYVIKDIVNMPSIMIRNYDDFILDEKQIELTCPKCFNKIELEYPLRLFNWRFMGLGYCSCCQSKVLQEVVVKKTVKGNDIYNTTRRIIDDVEYSDYAYKFKQIG